MSEIIYKSSMRLMGNRFEISVVCQNDTQGEAFIAVAVAEISRIEQILTTFNEASQTNKVNQNAGIAPVQVDREMFDLVQRAQRISDLTQGAFDITYGSIDKRFWNFDTTMTQLPSAETLKKSVRLINYRNVILDGEKSTIFLKNKGMRIGFGGIGKGYAAEMAKKCLQNQGVKAGIINASGDLCAWGTQPNGKAWTIGIADPSSMMKAFSEFELRDSAVATSGNYEKYAIIGGKRYSHTIDPKTGMPVSGIKSVTIFAPNAELADALTTPVMVMGIKVGLHLINQIKNIACLIVDENNKIHTSSNINLK
jgi:FAD:protein FMN transferase